MKLNVGDVIQIHGWVMLSRLNDGDKLKVAKITKEGFVSVYWFTKPKGKKLIVGHKTSNVDSAIHDNGMNRIEIVKQ